MRWLAVFSLVAGSLFVAPPEAEACGGTFCDAGPQAMPVDQSGENIVFVLDGTSVEVHIQIQYQGEAENFAWVIPLTALPEFTVGSDQLFNNLLMGTVPTYGYDTQQDACPSPTNNPVDDGFGGAGGGTSSGGGEDPEGDGGGPEVIYEETVGAFDIVVLEGGTAQEVVDWLDTNGYQQDPEAEPILAEYVNEGHLFAAFKLTGGAGVEEIHPVTLTYPGNEPCVPLRLTRIAAVEDMEIRTFFLGNERAAPTNYKHVLVNPLKLDWPNFAANYKEVITAAVNEAQAGGKAFVTEYAGPSNVVPPVAGEQWISTPFETLEAVDVADELSAQGLMFCEEWSGQCQYNHTLVEGLLAQYLPVPAGLSAYEFYSCLSCNVDQIDTTVWGGPAFAAAMQERIIDPATHARDLLETWSYVTRLYTTISPAEMTADPIFHTNPDLDDVAASRQGTRRILCGGDFVYYLPDGREVYLPQGNDWPDFQAEMPWVEEVDDVPLVGVPTVLLSQTTKIDKLLAQYNARHGWPVANCDCRANAPFEPLRKPGWLGLALFLGVVGVGPWLGRRRRRT